MQLYVHENIALYRPCLKDKTSKMRRSNIYLREKGPLVCDRKSEILKRVANFQETEALQAQLALVFQNLNVPVPLPIKSLPTSGPSGLARMFSFTSVRC